MSDDTHSDIVVNNNEYSDTDSNVDEAELQDAKQQILGCIFTSEQCTIIKVIKRLENMKCPDDEFTNIIIWAWKEIQNG